MSEYFDRDRVRDLLRRIDEITKESERIRQKIEEVRNTSVEWPDPRRGSRLFDEGQPLPDMFPSRT